MGDGCRHEWAEHWFTVSARISRGGSESFVVTNARLERCSRCQQFLVPEQVIAQRLFSVDEASDVLIRLTEDDTLP
jgi:hypothetical protein